MKSLTPGIKNSSVKSIKEIHTSVLIEASPEIVWNILTDFDKYPLWNTFITSINGDISEGKTIEVKAGGMKFKPTILKCEKNKEFRWLGKLFFKGIFDGEHIFQIIDNNDGTSTFQHSELFSGFLVMFFSKKLDGETTQGFKNMNTKLKELSENI